MPFPLSGRVIIIVFSDDKCSESKQMTCFFFIFYNLDHLEILHTNYLVRLVYTNFRIMLISRRIYFCMGLKQYVDSIYTFCFSINHNSHLASTHIPENIPIRK